ncbi:MAG TPA: hypothetical protein VFJ85_07320 [Acidimicrobiales bacterium]|nr:hypothetical protein [Acidimicrobiales bacterium]
MLIFLVVVCVVFGGLLFLIFANFLNDDDYSGSRFSLGGDGLPRLSNMPAGCLIAIIVTGAIWFILWGIVLLLALNLLHTPLGN